MSTTAEFLDLMLDAPPATDSIAWTLRDGARLELKRKGHGAAYLWLEECERIGRLGGYRGIANAAHSVKLELMRGDLAQSRAA